MPSLDAQAVREWRNRRMLSQQEVADRAETSLFTIQRIERGEGAVRPKTGRAVAAALGVEVEDLLAKKARAPRSDSEAAALAVLFRGLARRGRKVIERSVKEGPSPELSREADEYHQEYEALLRIKGGRDILGRDPEELAEAVDAHEEVEKRIQAMLRQDIDGLGVEVSPGRLRSKGGAEGTEEAEAG